MTDHCPPLRPVVSGSGATESALASLSAQLCCHFVVGFGGKVGGSTLSLRFCKTGIIPASQSSCKAHMRLRGPVPVGDLFSPHFLGPSASPKDFLSGYLFFQISCLWKEHRKLCFEPAGRAPASGPLC